MNQFFKKLFLVATLFLVFSPVLAEDRYQKSDANYSLKVAEVLDVNESKNPSFQEQLVKIQIQDEKKEELFLTNLVPDNQAYAIKAEKGRKYLVAFDDQSDQIYITDHYREPVIISLILSFLILVIIFGGFRGIKAIFSLALTGLAIVYFLIPGIKSGQSPIALAIMVSAFATAVTMIMIAGFSKKSLAATIGTTGGVSAAGIIAILVVKMAPLSGLASGEARILLGNLTDISLNFQGILAAGVLISSLGAAMDVAISIASSAQEIYETNKNQSKSELFIHLMNIGKDIMGTMVNTLILAYTGASIPLFLLLYNETGLRLLNMEIIATELTAATVGSIGLLLAIPITAAASAFLLKAERR